MSATAPLAAMRAGTNSILYSCQFQTFIHLDADSGLRTVSQRIQIVISTNSANWYKLRFPLDTPRKGDIQAYRVSTVRSAILRAKAQSPPREWPVSHALPQPSAGPAGRRPRSSTVAAHRPTHRCRRALLATGGQWKIYWTGVRGHSPWAWILNDSQT